ncbi:MAG: glycosyltransferase family 2 protein, partial [Victivallaceae bacterium]
MDVPVLLTVFNRPATSFRVLAAIRAAGVSRLYIAADGPRADRPGEAELCAGLRAQLLAAIDWPCEVKTLFREQNLGCGRAMASAVDWFFSEVEEGIILEDDCLPHPDFFRFAAAALAFYRADERVMCINGTQLAAGWSAGQWSCGFSRFAQIWGWAS